MHSRPRDILSVAILDVTRELKTRRNLIIDLGRITKVLLVMNFSDKKMVKSVNNFSEITKLMNAEVPIR